MVNAPQTVDPRRLLRFMANLGMIGLPGGLDRPHGEMLERRLGMTDTSATDLVPVVDLNGRRLSPCSPEKAQQNLEDGLATLDHGILRLNYRPLGYRHVYRLVRSRDGLVCAWCYQPGSTLEHVLPICWGGRTSLDNCVIACRACNHSRNNALPSVFVRWSGVRPNHPVILKILRHERHALEAAEQSLSSRPLSSCISKEEAQIWVAYHHGDMDRIRPSAPNPPFSRLRPQADPFMQIFVP